MIQPDGPTIPASSWLRRPRRGARRGPRRDTRRAAGRRPRRPGRRGRRRCDRRRRWPRAALRVAGAATLPADETVSATFGPPDRGPLAQALLERGLSRRPGRGIVAGLVRRPQPARPEPGPPADRGRCRGRARGRDRRPRLVRRRAWSRRPAGRARCTGGPRGRGGRSRHATAGAAEQEDWQERLAHLDPLTGLANRRTLDRVLELEIARAGRQQSDVSVAVFDVDGFRAVNEREGAAAGERSCGRSPRCWPSRSGWWTRLPGSAATSSSSWRRGAAAWSWPTGSSRDRRPGARRGPCRHGLGRCRAVPRRRRQRRRAAGVGAGGARRCSSVGRGVIAEVRAG